MGFPVYRDITSGRQYGFIMCSHNLSVGDYVFEEDSDGQPTSIAGIVRLTRLGLKYDVSFVSLYENASCSRNINKTLFSLIPSNDEITHPVCGRKVFYNSRNQSNSSGSIISTNFSGSIYNEVTHETTWMENLVQTNIPVDAGDSGGLVSSQGVSVGDRIQEGIIIAKDGSHRSLVCSAYDIVNLWYLTCY